MKLAQHPASVTYNVTIYISDSRIEQALRRTAMSVLVCLALENIFSLH